jgi:hypothetical protein
MAKIWVLDTETKGTGAEMVPLEKVLKKPAPADERIGVIRGKPGPRPSPPPQPKQPPRFKVADVMSREVLAEGADARATVALLDEIRSVVDVMIYIWDEQADAWRLLTGRDQKVLWGFRRRARTR